jgi:simple sugar transport system substrate-binding protein
MINQFKEAVAAQPSCIGIMGHPGSAAFQDLVKQATDSGIVVTVGNSPMTDLQQEFGPKGTGYAGVDLYAGGKLTAEQMIEKGGLKAGDEAMVYGVFSQAERGQSEKASPTRWKRPASRWTGWRSPRSQQRRVAGRARAYRLRAGASEPEGDRHAARRHHRRAGRSAHQGRQAAGRHHRRRHRPRPATIDGLKSGYISATLDQLLYLQGFMPVVQCVMTAKYKCRASRSTPAPAW